MEKKRKRRFGDRPDGRLLRTIDPMMKIVPYIMPQRNDALNSFRGTIDMEKIDAYVHEKKAKGMKNFTSMHVLLAAYVRVVSQRPQLNRFVSGQKIYARNYFEVMMSVKKEMKIDSPDSVISMLFPLDSTAEQVYEIAEKEVQAAKGEVTDFDTLVKVLDYIPGLVKKFVVWLLRTLDYFGLLPLFLMRLSPFHASMYTTSMASLGLPPVYHHIYNFGNVPVFLAFGIPEWRPVGKASGEVEVRKVMGYTMVMDERICDGYYYASCFRMLNGILRDPWQLDVAPAEVIEDVD